MMRIAFAALVRRNIRMFFSDMGLFLTSLITPVILLLLYITFLAGIYRDNFTAGFSAGITVPQGLVDGFVSAQLVSSVLAVCTVTVSFCSNMLMVQDKANGTLRDLTVSCVDRRVLAVSYYCASFVSTLIINLVTAAAGLLYMAVTGWYMSPGDVVCLILDVVLMVLFGTAASGVVNFFLSSQGQISAVGTLVSSCYGFISGAYMPISQFSPALQKVISFLPGTYGTSLLRNHAMGGVFRELSALGIPSGELEALRDVVDCNIYLFGEAVGMGWMFAVPALFTAAFLLVYILLNFSSAKRNG